MNQSDMDKETQIALGEYQLKGFGSFLEDHDLMLKGLLTKHEESTSNPNAQIITRKFYSPVKIDFSSNREKISIFQLVETEHKILNKIIITFASLCDEAEYLKETSAEYQQKFLYLDEDLYNCNDSKNEDYYIKISSSLEFLCNVQFLVQRCIIVATAILHQLGALFNSDNLDININIRFQVVLDNLLNIVTQLVIFDEILSGSNFCKFWNSYKKTMHSISKNVSKFKAITEVEMNGLVNILSNVEFVFSGNLFQTFLDSTFQLKEQIGFKALGVLSGHFQEYFKTNLAVIEQFTCDLCEFKDTDLIVRMNMACVLHHNFFGQVDQKRFRQLLEFNNKHNGITLIGSVLFRHEKFLRKHASTLTKNYERILQDTTRLRPVQLQAKVQNLQRDIKTYNVQIALWAGTMKDSLQGGTHNLKLEDFKKLCTLFLQGLQFIGQLSFVVKSITNLHVLLNTPMNKRTLLTICKFIQHMKLIQMAFNSDIENVAKIIQCIIQYLQYKILLVLATTKKKLSSETYNDRNIDILAAIQIAEKCLFGPATRTRLLVAHVAIDVSNQNRVFSSESYHKLIQILNRLKLLGNLQDNLDKLCDPTFLYWHQTIIPVYLKQIVEKKMDFNLFKIMVKTMDDCRKNIEKLNLHDSKLIEALKKSNSDHIKNELIDKLCAQIEMFLRIEIHSNLQQEEVNPMEQAINDYRSLITSGPVLLNGDYMIIKDQVENYLNIMFYNLTTISLHDWRTYAEMRYFAKEKLKLETVDDYLPTQTLEQGIDVLEIMRNIHIFVSKYLYSMNNQIFVEQYSNNKHLNTIGIRHIANSLRTHGTGIINTTINFTYQFLRKKFYTFSQFLFDEQIKSRLIKDSKFFRENKDKLGQMYSYERADNFNKGIKRLGLMPDGQSYLDLFRQLITHIGNAMGYIRLIKSGSMHANYNASVYLPRFEENLTFSNLVKEDKLSEEIIKAAENFETSIKHLSNNFSESTEYFQMLVEAFNPFFRDTQNTHLRHFYLIAPPLTINFVEYMLNAKDKIHKKDKHGAFFVDDGFALGLTYILKLLNQYSEFDSLHWFKSVSQTFDHQLSKIGRQREGAMSNERDVKLDQTLTLTEKRIADYRMEFDLLNFHLNSSRIFFY